MAIKRIKPEIPENASYRLKRRAEMPPVHEQLDALWSSLASMQMRGLTIPKGSILKTTQGDVELSEDLHLEFDLPKPMDEMMGRINGVRRRFPKEQELVEEPAEEPIKEFVDEETGKSYKTESALKAAITRRKNKAKKTKKAKKRK